MNTVQVFHLLRLPVLAMVLCLLSSIAISGEKPTDKLDPAKLYPFQPSVEAKLKGTQDERRRIAVLLPLRVLLAAENKTTDGENERLGDYLKLVMQHVEEARMKEALPLLERVLRSDRWLFGEEDKDRAASAWFHIRAADMAAREKTELAWHLFLGKAKFPGGARAGAHILYKFLKISPHLTSVMVSEALTGKGLSLANSDDDRRAIALGALVVEKRLAPSEKTLEKVLRSDNLFSKVAVYLHLLQKKDARAIEVARSMWTAQVPAPLRARLREGVAVSDPLAAVKGADAFYLQCLKDLDREDESVEREQLRATLLSSMWRQWWIQERHRDAGELKTYLNSCLKRPVALDEAALRGTSPEHVKRKLELMRHKLAARQWEARVLKECFKTDKK